MRSSFTDKFKLALLLLKREKKKTITILLLLFLTSICFYTFFNIFDNNSFNQYSQTYYFNDIGVVSEKENSVVSLRFSEPLSLIVIVFVIAVNIYTIKVSKQEKTRQYIIFELAGMRPDDCTSILSIQLISCAFVAFFFGFLLSDFLIIPTFNSYIINRFALPLADISLSRNAFVYSTLGVLVTFGMLLVIASSFISMNSVLDFMQMERQSIQVKKNKPLTTFIMLLIPLLYAAVIIFRNRLNYFFYILFSCSSCYLLLAFFFRELTYRLRRKTANITIYVPLINLNHTLKKTALLPILLIISSIGVSEILSHIVNIKLDYFLTCICYLCIETIIAIAIAIQYISLSKEKYRIFHLTYFNGCTTKQLKRFCAIETIAYFLLLIISIGLILFVRSYDFTLDGLLSKSQLLTLALMFLCPLICCGIFAYRSYVKDIINEIERIR